MSVTRRDFAKLVVTTSFLSVGVAELGAYLQQAKNEAVVRGEFSAPVTCAACGAACGLLFVKRGDRTYLMPNLRHPQPGMCFRPASALQLWNHPLLRAYYKPAEFLEIMTRVGPQILSAYRVGPDVFRVSDGQVRATLCGVFTGMGCQCKEEQEFLKVNCNK